MPGLKPSDFKVVEAAVRKFESKTRGELVPLVVRDAGEYIGIRYQTGLIGFGVAFLLGEAWSLARSWPLDAHEMTIILGLGAFLGMLLGMVPAVARLVVGRTRLDRIVDRRALAEFTRLGCGNTRERIGILIMVALFEHRIEIVADRGIQKVALEKEGTEVWDRVTAAFSKAAKEGRAVEGLVAAIEALGEVLARHFPPDGSTENELSDELRTVE
jgi:putative membrane protein